MPKALIYLVFLLATALNAQEMTISFDFEKDLKGWQQSQANHWSADTIMPINGAASLHHNFDSSISDYDVIAYSHPQVLLDSAVTQWAFKVRYAHTPSSSNNWAIWLTSTAGVEEMHSSGLADGYILGVNYSGSDDMLKLWKQAEGAKTVLLTTDFNWQELVSINDDIELLVERTQDGVWSVSVKQPETDFVAVGSVQENSIIFSEYLGFYYEYTSTQDMKLWVDDLSLQAFFYEDKQAPTIKNIKVLTSTEVDIEFAENIDTNVIPLYVLNYKVKPVEINWRSRSKVSLKFKEPFLEGNVLEVYNISDTKGNVAQVISTEFTYYLAEKFDVIITEIMADPAPVIGLPDCEYLELFNRTNKPLSLNGWTLYSGERDPLVFGDVILQPQSYMLLIESKYVEEFSVELPIYQVEDLPTLPNSGEKLMLFDDRGGLIHSLSYSYNTYGNIEKKEGGWSMEMVDLDYPCLQSNNWKASEAVTGGTPGFENSVSGTLQEYPVVKLKTVSGIDQYQCVLMFTQSVDSLSAINASNYLFELNDVQVETVDMVGEGHDNVRLSFSERLNFGKKYTLLIENIEDCSGIIHDDMVVSFGVPEAVDSGDVLMSEILYESNDEKPEFIELYNASEKVINMKGFSLAGFNDAYDTIKAQRTIVDSDYLFFPDTYIVLTGNKFMLGSLVSYSVAERVLELNSWLSLSNSGGKVAILDANDFIVDKMSYSPDQHYKLLSNTSGVSLERISFDVSGLQKDNWHSAATGVNYFTPGLENSQLNNSEKSEAVVSLSTNEISPDNDGLNDILTISYRMSEPGYIGDIKIFDQQGRLVNHRVNNELLELTGNYFWDGLGENGERLAMGYYIVLFEAWNPKGNKINEKLIVLLLPEKK